MADAESPSGSRLRALNEHTLVTGLSETPLVIFSSDQEPELKVSPGSDRSSLPLQFQRIMRNAEQNGYRATLSDSHFGLVTIHQNAIVEAHLRIGEQNLVPGLWEEKVATMYAQLRSCELLETYADTLRRWNFGRGHSGFLANTEAETLTDAFREVLGIPRSVSIRLVVEEFSPALQVSIFAGAEQISCIARNNTVGMLLEFRLDPDVLRSLPQKSTETKAFLPFLSSERIRTLCRSNSEALKICGISPATLSDIREEINRYGLQPGAALKKTAQNPSLRVLGIGDSHLGFGDPHRRYALEMLNELPALGFTHFAIEAPSFSTPRIQEALRRGDIASAWRDISPLGDVRLINAEYIALVQRAHQVGLTVIAVGGSKHSEDEHMASIILTTLENEPNSRIALLADSPHLGRNSNDSKNASAADLIRKKLGESAIRTLLSITHQLPGAALKQCTEGPSKDDGLKDVVLLAMHQCSAIAKSRTALTSQHLHGAWDFVLLYPGSDRRFTLT